MTLLPVDRRTFLAATAVWAVPTVVTIRPIPTGSAPPRSVTVPSTPPVPVPPAPEPPSGPEPEPGRAYLPETGAELDTATLIAAAAIVAGAGAVWAARQHDDG